MVSYLFVGEPADSNRGFENMTMQGKIVFAGISRPPIISNLGAGHPLVENGILGLSCGGS
jgi:hypothetical protein